ncbi:hypothetical protein NSQ93_04225 [Bacillus sp. FSL W8-0445]|jgi:hypothetical protein|uniref:hypothetical protein n=1 Tax=Bacillus TaxID=1386 RepID=UPI00039EF25C|nr:MULTISPECIES: hypothetical protein [Bacillus]AOP14598.1 hypothetical protein BL1202_01650 [Bacillus licheniformis]AYC51067.1 hypothetical protein C7M53_07320 [Bacillus licheniformis]KJE29771.1 hypothetical protein LG49_2440 [Bacillus licheniformis]MBM6846057.1 hypothetical protein [Bacillus licheniformis]MCM3212767.1 hypothetical protein [Bacillus licheniformis]
MKEYEISLSNGREFYRNDEGSCWLDGEYETNHDIVISELSEEIIRLLVENAQLDHREKEIKQLWVENEQIKGKNAVLQHKMKFYSDAIEMIRAEIEKKDIKGAYLLMLWLMEKTEEWGEGD